MEHEVGRKAWIGDAGQHGGGCPAEYGLRRNLGVTNANVFYMVSMKRLEKQTRKGRVTIYIKNTSRIMTTVRA